jgi:hypothetical protein
MTFQPSETTPERAATETLASEHGAPPRQLPRSNTAATGESLAGYLLRLAHRLALPPSDLIRRVGIKPTGRVSLLDVTYAAALPNSAQVAFAAATGLTTTEVEHLTLQRFGDTLHIGRPDKRVARSDFGNQWITPWRTRYCPECLAADSIWRLEWATPWALACTRHASLLLDSCPTCETLIGEPGAKGFRSLVPHVTLDVTHPAACRARRTGTTMCGTRLDHPEAPTAHPDLLRLQANLDTVLASDDPHQTTLGHAVDARQWLRDLRAVNILLTVAREQAPLSGLPYAQHAHHHVQTRVPNEGRHTKGDRTATQAPSDTAAAAGLMLAAQRLLADQPDELNRLHLIAAETEPIMWASTRTKTVLSDGLAEAFGAHTKNVTRARRLQVHAGDATFTFEAKHVAPYLHRDTFNRHFADIHGPAQHHNRNGYERPLRRYVPIALTMLVTDLNATDAGALLGYSKVATDAGCARASEAFDHLNNDGLAGQTELHRRVIAIACELERLPRINWQARRDWFLTDWALPNHEWDWLTSNVGRRNTPWERRRPLITAWVWAITSGSDIKDAPTHRTTTNGRTHSNGASAAVMDLIQRGGPDLTRAVEAIALRVAATIDADLPTS